MFHPKARRMPILYLVPSKICSSLSDKFSMKIIVLRKRWINECECGQNEEKRSADLMKMMRILHSWSNDHFEFFSPFFSSWWHRTVLFTKISILLHWTWRTSTKRWFVFSFLFSFHLFSFLSLVSIDHLKIWQDEQHFSCHSLFLLFSLLERVNTICVDLLNRKTEEL